MSMLLVPQVRLFCAGWLRSCRAMYLKCVCVVCAGGVTVQVRVQAGTSMCVPSIDNRGVPESVKLCAIPPCRHFRVQLCLGVCSCLVCRVGEYFPVKSTMTRDGGWSRRSIPLLASTERAVFPSSIGSFV